MDKKQKFFACVMGFAVSAGIGAGATYLANYKKIEFMNRHSGLFEAEKFAKETIELPLPEHNKDSEIKAYFDLYGDKYTIYNPNEDILSIKSILEDINDSSCAKLGGYRIRFNENDEPYFSMVEEDSPAGKSGIKAGDIIKNINDFDLAEPRHVKRLNGEDGEPVKLILQRGDKEVTVNYTRHTDLNKDVPAVIDMYGDTLYANINAIDEIFLTLLDDAPKFDSVIFDLRQNPGGNPEIAVSIADRFIGASETVLHSYSGVDEVLETQDELEYEVPIVVLVDGQTASAAEILAALLKQYGDAELVGMNTFGKGLYQYTAFINGNPLIYTDGYCTVGDWENYQGVGIKPDVEIDMSPDHINTDKDIQLEKALEIIKGKVKS